METFTRLLVAALIIGSFFASYRLYNAALLHRNRKLASGPDGLLRSGLPNVLFFSSPDCAPCRTMQKPVMEQLAHYFGDRLNIVEIDTTRKPEIAKRWGVQSLPTTIIIDQTGRARSINHGVAALKTLERQITSTLK